MESRTKIWIRKLYFPRGDFKESPGSRSEEILEYCESGIDPVKREQYYFSEFKPEYNILEQAGSSIGYKHTAATLEFFNKERKVNEETRKNLSLSATGRVLTAPLGP